MTRRLLLAAASTLVLLVAGCATSPDAPMPDLEADGQHTEDRRASLDATESSIERELDSLQQLRADLDTVGEQIADIELPLALLRLVAMNCLNATPGDSARDTIDLEGRPLSCEPAHLETFREALADHPTTARDAGYQVLYLVDQARLLRASLRQRLALLPQEVSEHYEYIAEERARLRQLSADVEQQRSLYSASDWREVHRRIDDHHQQLQDLEDRIEALAADFPDWPERVNDTTSRIYFHLSDLRRQTPAPSE